VLLIERQERGDLCARITFATVSERVEKRMPSPDCVVEDKAGEEAGCY